jgi:hypothetical protein
VDWKQGHQGVQGHRSWNHFRHTYIETTDLAEFWDPFFAMPSMVQFATLASREPWLVHCGKFIARSYQMSQGASTCYVNRQLPKIRHLYFDSRATVVAQGRPFATSQPAYR